MATSFFDKSKFLAANKRNKEENPFGDIDPGFYMAELVDAKIGPAKSSGRHQAMFLWQIDADTPVYANKKIAQCIGLEGEHAEKGYSILNIILSQLGIRSIDQFAENPDEWMEKLIGTTARLNIFLKDQYTQIRIVRAQNNINQVEPEQINGEALASGAHFVIGAQATVTVDNGERLAVIEAYHQQTNKVMIRYCIDGEIAYADPDKVAMHVDAGNNPVMYNPNLVAETVEQSEEVVEEVAEEIEEVPEEVEEETVTLEIGMNVTGMFNGKQTITGTIHAFSEDQTKVKIKQGKQVYACPIESITLIQ